MADCSEALKLGEVLVAYGRVMFIGHGGVGKTSLLSGLMNLPCPEANSTQLADTLTVRPSPIISLSEDIPFSKLWMRAVGHPETFWTKVTDDDEIDELAGLVLLVSNVVSGRSHSSRSAGMMYSESQEGSSSTRRVSAEYQSLVSSVQNKVVHQVLSRAVELAKKNPNAQAPESEVLMNVWDCGGQYVFLEVLPAFLTARTMFFLLYDAHQDIHSECVTRSYKDGKETSVLPHGISVLHMLQKWMASIHASLAGSQSDGGIPDFPRIMPIGTHGDDPSVKSKKKEIIDKLYTECADKAFSMLLRQGVIVDNTTAGQGKNEDPGFKYIRREVYDFASNNTAVRTPVSWVLFRKILQRVAKDTPIISYAVAVEVARVSAIREDVVPSVLKFYHDLGVFFYYAHISSLKDHIIIDPRWLIQQLAKLLALEGFEAVRNPTLWKPLREKGILVQPLYEELWKENKLSAKSFIDLLESFQLVAEIDKRSSYLKEHCFPGTDYLVPSVLPSPSKEQTAKLVVSTNVKEAASLHLIFSTHYVPPGFFTRLITALTNEKKCHVTSWSGFYRHQFNFLFGEEDSLLDEVSVHEHFQSVEVKVCRTQMRESLGPMFSSTCRNILKLIQTCCSYIRQWLPSIEVFLAFRCEPCCSSGVPEHFIRFTSDTSTATSRLRCERRVSCVVTPNHQFWLNLSNKDFAIKGSIESHEFAAVAQVVSSAKKFKELADTLEMSPHIPLLDDDTKTLLYRWQKEVKQLNLHARSQLVHGLRLINLHSTAEKLRYGEFLHKHPGSVVELTVSESEPLSNSDIFKCAHQMTDGDLEQLAAGLNISDDQLEQIQSRYKKPASQANQILKKWQSTTQGSRQMLISNLRSTGFHKAADLLENIDKPTMKDLLTHVKVVNYYRLGLELDISDYDMRIIQSEVGHNIEEALRRTFVKWLDTCKKPTWRAMVIALKNIEMSSLAHDIEKQFCQ